MKEFRSSIQLLTELKNEAIKETHWKQLMEHTGTARDRFQNQKYRFSFIIIIIIIIVIIMLRSSFRFKSRIVYVRRHFQNGFSPP